MVAILLEKHGHAGLGDPADIRKPAQEFYHVPYPPMAHNPADADWFNRDRFVLSNGHACALQYSMLHLTGYPLSLDDCKAFRQVESLTPGHPENFMTAGVEVSTGPLGQGLSNAVGLALSEAHLAATFNKEGH